MNKLKEKKLKFFGVDADSLKARKTRTAFSLLNQLNKVKHFIYILIFLFVAVISLKYIKSSSAFYSLIGIVYSVKAQGIFIALFPVNQNFTYFPSLPRKIKKQLDKKGNIYYIVKPGFKIVKVKVVQESIFNRKQLTLTKPISENKNVVEEGDWVVDKKTLARSIKNRNKYKKLKVKVKNIEIVKDTPDKIFIEGINLLVKKKYWKAIEKFLIIITHFSNLYELSSKAQMKIAYTFGGVDWSIEKNEFVVNLNDPINCREELLVLINKYPIRKLKEIAYYLLAIHHLCYLPAFKNERHFRYMEKAGILGKIYFSCGKNILETLEPNSILFIDPRIYITLPLYYQIYYKNQRPDVSVYHPWGIGFNSELKGIKEIYEMKSYNLYSKYKFGNKKYRPVYYTWRKIPIVIKGFDYYPVGILYKLVKTNELNIKNRPVGNIWEKYQYFNFNIEKSKKIPVVIREILSNYYIQKGEYYDYNNRKKEVEKEFTKALKIGYNIGDIFYNYGLRLYLKAVKLQEQGLKNKSIFWYNKAIQVMEQAYRLFKLRRYKLYTTINPMCIYTIANMFTRLAQISDLNAEQKIDLLKKARFYYKEVLNNNNPFYQKAREELQLVNRELYRLRLHKIGLTKINRRRK